MTLAFIRLPWRWESRWEERESVPYAQDQFPIDISRFLLEWFGFCIVITACIQTCDSLMDACSHRKEPLQEAVLPQAAGAAPRASSGRVCFEGGRNSWSTPTRSVWEQTTQDHRDCCKRFPQANTAHRRGIQRWCAYDQRMYLSLSGNAVDARRE